MDFRWNEKFERQGKSDDTDSDSKSRCTTLCGT